jgi:hypothetical protein
VLIALGLLACGSARQHAALGWSLGGEAHVFVADDRFARDFYRELTGGRLDDTLAGHALVALEPRAIRGATVLSARGAAAARLTLVRFHAPQSCGSPARVTELVLEFPPGGASGRSTPPSHVTVVALLDAPPLARGAGPQPKPLSQRKSLELVNQVATRAESRGSLVASLTLDPDKSADAGEVIAVSPGRYAVGLRARFRVGDDTLLVTAVAVTDTGAHSVHWVVRPVRSRLINGMIQSGKASRYSLRGAVARPDAAPLLLLDEIADVSPRDSRASAVDPETGRVVATQPLALRCP